MRPVLSALAVMLCLALTLAPGPVRPALAASAWKVKEQECISRCPPFPRFGGIEDNKAWAERMKKQQAYDACYMGCVKQQMSAWRRPYTPSHDGSRAYFKRNLF